MYKKFMLVWLVLVVGIAVFSFGSVWAEDPKPVETPVPDQTVVDSTVVHERQDHSDVEGILYAGLDFIPESRVANVKYPELEGMIKAEVLANPQLGVKEQDFAAMEYWFYTANSQWVSGGYDVFTTKDYNQLPVASASFLAKIQEGKVLDVAVLSTQKFADWVDSVPMDIFPFTDREFLKFVIQSDSTVGAASGISTPEMGFPWQVGKYRRFTSAPHSYNGPTTPNTTWSGIDFAPYTKGTTVSSELEVRAVMGGKVVDSKSSCFVVIEDQTTKWAVRYLHIDGIKVKKGDMVSRGQHIASIDRTLPICFEASGPHLHVDLLYKRGYYDINRFYMGGWQIVSTGQHYQGYLLRDGFIIKADSSSLASAVYNDGVVGSGFADAPNTNGQEKSNERIFLPFVVNG